ncbi:probable basic-leucine zipper transcription factor Q [Schistocerca gregaria]|uniref:probable basic-leucine zipper transcription factor Q n=1 Tax=Schistocerca gregaria TaxID=7010 RepID=UPI00211EB457|nr:probable basic-leucine zipper transcription factor Q [Schistocerca gregaria]
MALSLVLTLAVWCCAWQTAAGAGALLPSYQLLLPFPAGPAAPVAAPASRLVVLLPGASPQPLTATALDAAHQQVEAASARLSQVEAASASARLSPLPPQPSRADFQARAQAQAFPQQQQQQLQQQQLQQQLQQLQDESVVAARTSFQPPVSGRPDFQQQAVRQQQADYQVVSDGRGEFAAPAGPQPMRPSGLGRALQTPSYQALVADYRFRQQQLQLQQQPSSYQPLATQYQYRQPQRTSYQGVSTGYQYQQPSQAQTVSSAASRADFRPGPYPLPTPYSAARANLVQQQQQQQQQVQQQEYQQQQQQDYQQQGASYDASRPEFRSLQPQGLLPGQEYSVNFEGDGFGYGYTIRGDRNLQRAY